MKRLTALALAGAALLVVPVPVGAVAAPPGLSGAAQPGLSVAVSDGVGEVRSGADLTYTATLTNAGAKPVTTRMVLTVPPYLAVRAGDDAQVGAHSITWQVVVRPGTSVRRTVSAHVGAIPETERRVTTLVSIYQGTATSLPLIRSADADRIHGVDDRARSVAPASKASSSSSSGAAWAAVSAGALVIAAGAGLIGYRRRRSRTSP